MAVADREKETQRSLDRNGLPKDKPMGVYEEEERHPRATASADFDDGGLEDDDLDILRPLQNLQIVVVGYQRSDNESPDFDPATMIAAGIEHDAFMLAEALPRAELTIKERKRLDVAQLIAAQSLAELYGVNDKSELYLAPVIYVGGAHKNGIPGVHENSRGYFDEMTGIAWAEVGRSNGISPLEGVQDTVHELTHSASARKVVFDLRDAEPKGLLVRSGLMRLEPAESSSRRKVYRGWGLDEGLVLLGEAYLTAEKLVSLPGLREEFSEKSAFVDSLFADIVGDNGQLSLDFLVSAVSYSNQKEEQLIFDPFIAKFIALAATVADILGSGDERQPFRNGLSQLLAAHRSPSLEPHYRMLRHRLGPDLARKLTALTYNPTDKRVTGVIYELLEKRNRLCGLPERTGQQFMERLDDLERQYDKML